jgi:hypothetical protein
VRRNKNEWALQQIQTYRITLRNSFCVESCPINRLIINAKLQPPVEWVGGKSEYVYKQQLHCSLGESFVPKRQEFQQAGLYY